MDANKDHEYHVWCNICGRPVPVSELTHRTDYPSVGDLTHWHWEERTNTSHCITADPV
jgi:hypothetical protein